MADFYVCHPKKAFTSRSPTSTERCSTTRPVAATRAGSSASLLMDIKQASPAAVVSTDSQRAAARDADPLIGTNAPATPLRPGHRIAVVAVTLVVVAISALGGLGVNTDSAWYQGLDLPSWQPPGWLFGPVWTVLYILLARSAYLAWRDADGPRRRPILALYGANAILNVGWTYLFFRAERPALAGMEILVLLATIVALVVLMRPVNRQASWALVPYGAWVAFATALTWTITAAN